MFQVTLSAARASANTATTAVALAFVRSAVMNAGAT